MSYTPVTEPARVHAGIKYEVATAYCRDVVTIASGSNTAGNPQAELTLLGKITASGKYATHDPAATDGTESVAGILISPDIDSSSEDVNAVALVRGPACVVFAKLAAVNALDATATAAAKADLLALGIKCVEEI